MRRNAQQFYDNCVVSFVVTQRRRKILTLDDRYDLKKSKPT